MRKKNGPKRGKKGQCQSKMGKNVLDGTKSDRKFVLLVVKGTLEKQVEKGVTGELKSQHLGSA